MVAMGNTVAIEPMCKVKRFSAIFEDASGIESEVLLRENPKKQRMFVITSWVKLPLPGSSSAKRVNSRQESAIIEHSWFDSR